MKIIILNECKKEGKITGYHAYFYNPNPKYGRVEVFADTGLNALRFLADKWDTEFLKKYGDES